MLGRPGAISLRASGDSDLHDDGTKQCQENDIGDIVCQTRPHQIECCGENTDKTCAYFKRINYSAG
jgi:hypothetical protein